MATVKCPECEADVTVKDDAIIGDEVSCEECGIDLEVTGLGPLVVDIIEDEDFEDVDDF